MEWFWIFLLISHGSLFIIFYCLQRCLKKHIRRQLEQRQEGSVSIWNKLLRLFLLWFRIPPISRQLLWWTFWRQELKLQQLNFPIVLQSMKTWRKIWWLWFQQKIIIYRQVMKKLWQLRSIENVFEWLWCIDDMMVFYIKYNGLTAKRETKRF